MRTTATQTEGERLHIRIPADLKEAAKEAAVEDGRTMSNLVLHALRELLKQRGKLH